MTADLNVAEYNIHATSIRRGAHRQMPTTMVDSDSRLNQEAYAIGRSAYRSGNLSIALRQFDLALANDPANPEILVDRGCVLSDLGRYVEAVDDFNAASKASPHYAAPLNNKGTVFYELGEFGKAVESFDRAIELDPDYAAAFNNRALAFDELGEIERAIKDYRKAISLNPVDAEYHNNIAVSYRKKGTYDAAMASVNEAIRLNPFLSNAFCTRAEIKLARNEKTGFYKDLQVALELGLPIWEFVVDPVFDTVRGDSEFFDLISKFRQ